MLRNSSRVVFAFATSAFATSACRTSIYAALAYVFSMCTVALAGQPSIIVFLVDDMGWMDSSVYGSDYYATPNLQRLSDAGVTFTQAYAQPLCSPSRVALLTGRYPSRIGMHQAITGQSKPVPKLPARPRGGDKVIWPESRSHLPLSEITFAETVCDVGYETWFLGKWHLGAGQKYWPNQQGFDKVICVGGAGPRGGYFGPNQIPGLKPASAPGEYICERLTNEACQLIRNRNEKPFLMLLSHFNVHSPYEAREEDIERFANQRNVDSEHNNPVMAAMLWAMDKSLGSVMQCLEDEGLTNDTWLFFISDNGGVHWNNMKGELAERFPVPVTSNLPLRGGKACFYEGGVRIPMIVRGPRVVSVGERCDTPVHLIDVFPTIASIAQAKYDSKAVDGQDLVPLLTRAGEFPSRKLYCHFPRRTTLADTVGGSFVRDGGFKLIRHWFAGEGGDHKYELFDLESDIGENDNLAGRFPDRVQAMSKDLDRWLVETNALVPKLATP
ncbi:MAG TPA: hypothetical protein DDW52_04560 [Planctomycetaceae bacterium]|nr:hypothetical protein [Planctomycetaceae bacterium]